MRYIVGAAIGRPAHQSYVFALAFGEFVTYYGTDEQHPRVASLALRAIHLLLAPTNGCEKGRVKTLPYRKSNKHVIARSEATWDRRECRWYNLM